MRALAKRANPLAAAGGRSRPRAPPKKPPSTTSSQALQPMHSSPRSIETASPQCCTLIPCPRGIVLDGSKSNEPSGSVHLTAARFKSVRPPPVIHAVLGRPAFPPDGGTGSPSRLAAHRRATARDDFKAYCPAMLNSLGTSRSWRHPCSRYRLASTLGLPPRKHYSPRLRPFPRADPWEPPSSGIRRESGTG